MWEAVVASLTKYESIAIWLEGIALVALFFLDWLEYRRQGAERIEQHRESVAQMKIMQSHADATKASADALINIERAWLVPNGFVDPSELPSTRVVPGHVEELAVQIKNCGRTPAWLMEWLCKPLVADTADIQNLLDYSHSNRSLKGVPIPPNESENFVAEWKIERPSEIDEIREGRKQFYVYGFVRYKDIFGVASHDTYFCFHHSRRRDAIGRIAEGWAVEPEDANQHT